MSGEFLPQKVLFESEKIEIEQKYRDILNKILNQVNDLMHEEIDIPDLTGNYTGKYVKEYFEGMTEVAINELQNSIKNRNVIKPIDCNLEFLEQEGYQYVWIICDTTTKKEPGDTEDEQTIIYNGEYKVELTTSIEDDKTTFSVASNPLTMDIKEHIPQPRVEYIDKGTYVVISLMPTVSSKVFDVLRKAEMQCGILDRKLRERLKEMTTVAIIEILRTASVYQEETPAIECAVSQGCTGVTCKATVLNDKDDIIVVSYDGSLIIEDTIYTYDHYESPSSDCSTRTITVTVPSSGKFV